MARRLLIVVLLGFVAMLCASTGAFAHASLEASDPGASAVLESSPPQASLTFSEPINVNLGSIKVVDVNQREVGSGHPTYGDADGKTVVISLPKLDNGSYAITWQVVSADSHRITGARTFSVGAPSQAAPAPVIEPTEESQSSSLNVLNAVVRGCVFALTLLGGGLLLWLSVSESARSALTNLPRIAAGALILLAVLSLVGIATEAAYVSGASVGALLDVGLWQRSLELRSARSALTRAAISLCAVVAIATKARASTVVLSVLPGAAIVLALSLAFAGHASTGRLFYAGFALDVAHVMAAMVWIGGLVCLLALYKRSKGQEPAATTDEMRSVSLLVSRAAAVSVGVLAIAGVLQAIRQLASIVDVWQTGYGRFVLAKAVITGVVLAVAAASRRSVHSSTSEDWSQRAPQATKKVRNLVVVELVVLLAVVGVTTQLVSAVPSAREEESSDVVQRDDKPDGSTAASYSLQKTHGDVTFTLFVDRARIGTTNLRIETQSLNGLSEDNAADIQATLRSAATQSQTPLVLTRTSTGVYSSPEARFTNKGEWILGVSYLSSEAKRETLEFQIPVE